jgi:hypothetical protein
MNKVLLAVNPEEFKRDVNEFMRKNILSVKERLTIDKILSMMESNKYELKDDTIEDDLHNLLTTLETESEYDLDYHFENFRRNQVQAFFKLRKCNIEKQAQADAQKMVEEEKNTSKVEVLNEVLGKAMFTTSGNLSSLFLKEIDKLKEKYAIITNGKVE